MVFVNGQKFACATCIKGHRSTTCNHGERPLHEIKKKGRPSTQCPHCKELRKAKHVNARCICGREEGSAAVANGLKRAKSLSHDSRLSVPAAIGGEDLLRSVSTQGRSPQDCSDALSSNGGVANCACPTGTVCACRHDRASRVVVKSSKSASHAASTAPKGYPSNRQRSAASLDLGKAGIMLLPRDTASPLPFPPHAHGGQVLAPQGMNGAGVHVNGSSLPFQSLSPSGSTGCDHSPSSASTGYPSQMQSNLCFDYTSSSDYDSDHYNPTTSYSYFHETMTSYPVSNASDDMEDMDLMNPADSKKIMDDIMNGTTTLNPMESTSADELRMLYSALSSFPSRSFSSPGTSTSSSGLSNQSLSSVSSATTGCCGTGAVVGAGSPALSIPSHSPSAGRSELDEKELSVREGCGCGISSGMCCCVERCTCPAYPNNQAMLNSNLSMQVQSVSEDANQLTSALGLEGDGTLANDISLLNNSDVNSNLNRQALNLSAALNLIQGNNQLNAGGLGLSGLDMTLMQHPTLLGDNGILICGCGCGRPTVDCAECYRDMSQSVGEYQAKMLKDELEIEALRRVCLRCKATDRTAAHRGRLYSSNNNNKKKKNKNKNKNKSKNKNKNKNKNRNKNKNNNNNNSSSKPKTTQPSKSL
ncbi:hypothetical protein BGZ65_002508 [Modicella reniformis]|uniref:Copper-fist domain-containing protein n=1 Tax=Modicella reniformis TaxID=1440133 RepID=A0A9P6M9N1_9FUNG|nr:hypothetical protein BGZ65_002508 [Modicella reniformis]